MIIIINPLLDFCNGIFLKGIVKKAIINDNGKNIVATFFNNLANPVSK